MIIDHLVDEDALAVVQARQDRSAFDLDGVADEDEEQDHKEHGEDQIADEQSRLAPKMAARFHLKALHLDVAVVKRADVAKAMPARFFPLEDRHDSVVGGQWSVVSGQ